jgi:hypothetical protein
VLPSASVNSVGALKYLISRLNTLPAPTPVNASPPSSRTTAHDSGTSWVATPSTLDSCIPFSMPVYPGALTVRPTSGQRRREVVRGGGFGAA